LNKYVNFDKDEDLMHASKKLCKKNQQELADQMQRLGDNQHVLNADQHQLQKQIWEMSGKLKEIAKMLILLPKK